MSYKCSVAEKKALSIRLQKIKIDIKATVTTVVDVKEEKLLWT